MGAIDADHEHCGQCRKLNCYPHHADIVGQKREVHRKHQQLVHRVIEAQELRREPPDFELVADIAGAEDARREADERGQHDEYIVEVVHEQIRGRLRPAEKQRHRGEEGQ